MDQRTKTLLQRAAVAGLGVLVLTLLADQELWLAAVSAVAAAAAAWWLRPSTETWLGLGFVIVIGLIVVGAGAEVPGRVIVAAGLGAVWPVMMDAINRSDAVAPSRGEPAA